MARKVLYIITKDDVGGAQKYVRDLAENVDKEKFEAKVLTGGKNGIRFLSNSFRPYALFLNDWLAVAELFFILREEKPDILHLNSSKAGVIGSFAASLYKLSLKLHPTPYTLHPKVIFTAHGWVFNPDNDLIWPLRKFYILLHKLAAKFQDRIINVSEYDKKLAISHKISHPEKLVTVHNGLDLKRTIFLDKTAARKALIKLHPTPYTLHPNEVWVGSVGRLVKEKNYETFVKAAALIKDQQVKFFILGEGYENKKLYSLIKNLGLEEKFFIIENLTPAAPYLKAFDIFALSSIKEGLPYTLLEAMAAERPVIATRVGGMPEIIESKTGEKRGLVIIPKEPPELARAIEYFLENSPESQNLAAAANRFLKENLTLQEMVKKTENIYLFG